MPVLQSGPIFERCNVEYDILFAIHSKKSTFQVQDNDRNKCKNLEYLCALLTLMGRINSGFNTCVKFFEWTGDPGGAAISALAVDQGCLRGLETRIRAGKSYADAEISVLQGRTTQRNQCIHIFSEISASIFSDSR